MKALAGSLAPAGVESQVARKGAMVCLGGGPMWAHMYTAGVAAVAALGGCVVRCLLVCVNLIGVAVATLRVLGVGRGALGLVGPYRARCFFLSSRRNTRSTHPRPRWCEGLCEDLCQRARACR